MPRPRSDAAIAHPKHPLNPKLSWLHLTLSLNYESLVYIPQAAINLSTWPRSDEAMAPPKNSLNPKLSWLYLTLSLNYESLVYIPQAAINLSTWPSNSQLCAQGSVLIVWTPASAGVQTISTKPCLPPFPGPAKPKSQLWWVLNPRSFHIGGPF